MKPWDKQEIVIAGGAKVMAQVPLMPLCLKTRSD